MNTALAHHLFQPLGMATEPEAPPGAPEELPDHIDHELTSTPNLFEQFEIRQPTVYIRVANVLWPSGLMPIAKDPIHRAFLGLAPPVVVQVNNRDDDWDYIQLEITIYQGRYEGMIHGKIRETDSLAALHYRGGDLENLEMLMESRWGNEILFSEEYIGDYQYDGFSTMLHFLYEEAEAYLERAREEVKEVEKKAREIAEEAAESEEHDDEGKW